MEMAVETATCPIHATCNEQAWPALAALLAFSLTLTNIFVRFNPISWWSCTIATRAPCRGPCLSLPRLASCASNTRQGRGNLFAAHADDDNKFERQMMPSFVLLCSAQLCSAARLPLSADVIYWLHWAVPEGVLSQISCIRLLLI